MHKHEWIAGEDVTLSIKSHAAHCDCGVVMGCEELERRLNATEELSAEDVDLILFVMVENSIAFNASPERQRIAKALRAYAERMEA